MGCLVEFKYVYSVFRFSHHCAQICTQTACRLKLEWTPMQTVLLNFVSQSWSHEYSNCTGDVTSHGQHAYIWSISRCCIFRNKAQMDVIWLLQLSMWLCRFYAKIKPSRINIMCTYRVFFYISLSLPLPPSISHTHTHTQHTLNKFQLCMCEIPWNIAWFSHLLNDSIYSRHFCCLKCKLIVLSRLMNMRYFGVIIKRVENNIAIHCDLLWISCIYQSHQFVQALFDDNGTSCDAQVSMHIKFTIGWFFNTRLVVL